MEEKEIELCIDGLGIIFFSKFAVADIEEGEDYLSLNYTEPEDVAKHINNGTIVGFCTGSSGNYTLNILKGYPSEQELRISDYKIHLAIEVRDNKIYFCDLYLLMDWNSNLFELDSINIENGYYLVTLCSNMPNSGILGDEQYINMYFLKRDKMPDLNYSGVPQFY